MSSLRSTGNTSITVVIYVTPSSSQSPRFLISTANSSSRSLLRSSYRAQCLSSSSSIPFHLDKDENHSKLHPTLPTKHPLISTVTYLKNSERSTIIFGENNILISKSEAGKHVAFSGEYIHGVGEGGRKRKREGKRLTVLVNVWLEKIMVDGFAESEELGDDNDFEEVRTREDSSASTRSEATIIND